jgi:Bacterial Ig-like domain (group 2)
MDRAAGRTRSDFTPTTNRDAGLPHNELLDRRKRNSNAVPTQGLASSVGEGAATITATTGSVSGSTTLTVTSAALVSIAINPQTSTVTLGTTQQFTATGTFTDGTTQDLTQSGHWSSTVVSVATISNTTDTAGLASTLGTGTTTIGISSGAISATATLVVNPAALVSIAINPQAPTIALGTTQQFTATGTYTDGTAQDLATVVTWNSSSATVAIISNAAGSYGLATSSGQGTATISATSNSSSSSRHHHRERPGFGFHRDYTGECGHPGGDRPAVRCRWYLHRWQHAGPDCFGYVDVFVTGGCARECGIRDGQSIGNGQHQRQFRRHNRFGERGGNRQAKP